MPPTSHPNDPATGAAIRERRKSLGLTIDQAANAAGIGSETWRRYETGQPIRADKLAAVCRTLRCHALSELAPETPVFASMLAVPESALPSWMVKEDEDDSEDGRAHRVYVARCVHLGIELLYDYITEEVDALASQPRGTHIGQLPSVEFSSVANELPALWLTRYDYEFFYDLRQRLLLFKTRWEIEGAGRVIECPVDHLLVKMVLSVAQDALDVSSDGGADDRPLSGSDVESIATEYFEETDDEDMGMFDIVGANDVLSQWHIDNWYTPLDVLVTT